MIDVVVRQMEPLLEIEQLRKLKVTLSINLTKFQIENQRNDIVIYDETADIFAYKQYFVSKKLQGLSDTTINLYMQTIDRFMRFTRKSFCDVTACDIRSYIALRGINDHLGNASLNRERGCICRFFSWLHDEDYIAKNPSIRVEQIKVEKRLKKAFTNIEIELLKNAAKSIKQKLVVELLLSTGCRVSELCSLQLSNYDRQTGTVTVIGKGNKERHVYINAAAKVSIDNYIAVTKHEIGPIILGKKGGPMTSSGIQKMITDLAKRAGVSHAHPHKFRRTAATLAVKRGMAIENVRTFLGHSSVNTTLGYIDNSLTDFKALHEKYLG
ncbi:hypothetical protein ID741_000991 [Enterococcus sp. AZ103]